MAGRAKRLCNENVSLAKAAKSESAKLRALRSIFSDVAAVSKCSDLAHRVAQIGQRLRDQADDADISGGQFVGPRKRNHSPGSRFAGTNSRADVNPVAVDLPTARGISPVAATPARRHPAAKYTSGQTRELPGVVHDCATFPTAQTAFRSARALRISLRHRDMRAERRRFGESKSGGGLLTRTRNDKFRQRSLSAGVPFLLPPEPVPPAPLITSQGDPCSKRKNP